MDTMDNFRERFEALEQQTVQLKHHSRTIDRQLRWWRGLACGLVVLALCTWALPVVTAQDTRHDDKKGLEHRVAALEKLLKHFRRDGDNVIIKGANLHIRNGLGETTTTNGLGNLIVGYNQPRQEF